MRKHVQFIIPLFAITLFLVSCGQHTGDNHASSQNNNGTAVATEDNHQTPVSGKATTTPATQEASRQDVKEGTPQDDSRTKTNQVVNENTGNTTAGTPPATQPQTRPQTTPSAPPQEIPLSKETIAHLNEKQKHKVKLTPAAPTPAFKDAELEFATYENGTLKFHIKGNSFRLGALTSDTKEHHITGKSGQYIGVIIDNNPPVKIFKTTYRKKLGDGGHRIFAYLGTSYDQAIKTPKAFISKKITVKNNSLVKVYQMNNFPELFCTSPAGNYPTLVADKVLLDFYLLNANIDSNHKIQLTINDGQSFIISQAKPFYMTGLPYGENEIELMLVNGNGDMIRMPRNPVKRSFILQNPPQNLSQKQMDEIIEEYQNKSEEKYK